MTNPTISVQLWSVRDDLAADVDTTLARIAALGFTTVEAFDFVGRVDELAASLTRHGLSAPTGHASLASEALNPFEPDAPKPPTNDEVFNAAKRLGMTIVIDPFVAPERWTTLADVQETARLLNAAAADAAAHGITVGYHNHNQEFVNQIDGRFALEVFAELLDPSVVLEIDLYWATAGGADAAALLERLGERVVAVHVKDGTLDPSPTLSEKPTDQVPAGTGVVPLTAALDAAAFARYAVVEFDVFEGDLWAALATSREFLVARGLN